MFYRILLFSVLIPFTAMAQDSTASEATASEPGILRYFLLGVILVGILVMIYEKKQRDKLNQ